jgi:dephospho-CoA kinase
MSTAVSARLRLALVAPSGSGKSTVARLLCSAFERRGLSVEVIKLAAPLYRLQTHYYSEARREIGQDSQDQPLLEQIATSLRRINPSSLVENFQQRLNASHAAVVINDDLRDDRTDWPFLRAQGFSVVKVVVSDEVRRQRLNLRNDVGVQLDSPLDGQMARIAADRTLENNGSIESLERAVDALAQQLAASTSPSQQCA